LRSAPPRAQRRSSAELAQWRTDGFCISRGVFSAAEAAALRAEAHALAGRLQERGLNPTIGTQTQGGWESASLVDAGPRALQGCHNVQYHSALFSRMIADPRLVDRAAELIGPNVQLHHTKMFIKPPEIGAPFPMHQDVPYFEHERHSMIAAVVHFDDSTVEKGCIRVVPGSWKLGRLDHIGEGGHHLEVSTYPVAEATPCEAAPGDVLFFSYMCIHGSMPNRHPTDARTSVLVQMWDPEDASLHPGLGNSDRAHESRGQGMMLRGVDPTCSSGKGVGLEPDLDRAATAAGARGLRVAPAKL
jgi:ectoine hydroxylase-related dioxygenase (phytanoyl-CoA dioxygenase family)